MVRSDGIEGALQPAEGPPPVRVLCVDDDDQMLALLDRLLRRAGIEPILLSSAEEALAAIGDPTLDVCVSDVNMPGMSGLELLAAVKAKRPGLEVVIMTGQGTIESAVFAVKTGAYDYLTKPFVDVERVVTTLRHAAERRRLNERTRFLEAMLQTKESFEELVGTSPKMRGVFETIDAVAKSPTTVLILGASGTGKELAARAIHRRSDRAGRPFLALNCSALGESVLESELFGHAKGAFTGAVTARKGLFEAAHGGTVFLDEIGDISPATQVRLLRVLQEGEVRRMGENDPVKVDVRVIAATHVDLAEAIKAGRFREDLYYRLHVVVIRMPSLRERPEDIPLLAQHFVDKVGKKLKKRVRRVSDEALRRLLSHSWPGNVRELENAIERGAVLCAGDEIQATDLPPGAGDAVSPGEVEAASVSHLPYMEAKRLAVAAFEQRYLGAMLRAHAGNLSAAARAAGIDRTNFRRLAKSYFVDVAESRGAGSGD